MAAKSAAQAEFDSILDASNAGPKIHPEDQKDSDSEEFDEEARHRNNQIDKTMRMPTLDRGRAAKVQYTLPHQSFDYGRATGVKGVIADARSYEQAKREGASTSRYRSVSSSGREQRQTNSAAFGKKPVGGSHLDSDSDENEEFLEQWRQARKRELMVETNDIRNRRTSPSVRRYGRFDEVDALGYLDAIEKVRRETVVVVFVYDHQSSVSQVIEDALIPLVSVNPSIHFVKVHYDDIEFDNAGVPAILAYRNQGELFANLTYIIGHIPDDTNFDTVALENVLRKHKILQ
ncbi:MAG: hypothetical protein M1818_007281 [Claussenomyces sp. TS43310]|nr:MAG: hypothetical protein M1818_007281 [Claussenomyces sp. TS43310]